MNPQLREIEEELRGASARLKRLVEGVDVGTWGRRPTPESWSVGECVAHLNLTSAATIPLVGEALEALEGRRGSSARRYRRDALGWLVWRSQRETTKMRTATRPAFVPRGDDPPAVARERFEALQEELLGLVRAADGLPLGAVKISSPFDSRVRYNVYAAFSIISAHEHRHLAQAERAAAACGVVLPAAPEAGR
jgi:hypothetical protein